MSLRDAIKEQHEEAERHPLTTVMMAGSLTPQAYAELLANQLIVYQAIESRASYFGISQSLPGVERSGLIMEDLIELSDMCGGLEFFASKATATQRERINDLDVDGVIANMYVHHMADMYGGQILKSKLPGKCRRYDFDDRSALVSGIRAMLKDEMASEANLAFEFTLQLFDDVADKHGLLAA